MGLNVIFMLGNVTTYQIGESADWLSGEPRIADGTTLPKDGQEVNNYYPKGIKRHMLASFDPDATMKRIYDAHTKGASEAANNTCHASDPGCASIEAILRDPRNK